MRSICHASDESSDVDSVDRLGGLVLVGVAAHFFAAKSPL
jgi:hypothetical protein